MQAQDVFVGDLEDNEYDIPYYVIDWPHDPAIIIPTPYANLEDHIVHEYGHAVMHWLLGFSEDTDCPDPDDGGHYPGLVTNVSCAFSEGFAEMFAVAINGNSIYEDDAEGHGKDFEQLFHEIHYRTHSEAIQDEGNVAVALYDLFDTHNDTVPGYDGRDAYSGGLKRILDVIRYEKTIRITEFWSWWKARGNPRHLPVLALYMNRINFNHAPVWTELPYRHVSPGEQVDFDLKPYIGDEESTDNELIVSVVSNSNPTVTVSVLPNQILRATISDPDTGSTDITLRMTDELESADSDELRITWSSAGGSGPKPPPPDPCEEPCPITPRDKRITALGQNTPNPFNPVTTIPFSVGHRQRVTAKIYNVEGSLVRVLYEGEKDPDYYTITWDGLNNRGTPQATGIYFLVLATEDGTFTRKMVLLK
jgi:hypothetical protein